MDTAIQAVLALVALCALALSVRSEIRLNAISPNVKWTVTAVATRTGYEILFENEGRKTARDVRLKYGFTGIPTVVSSGRFVEPGNNFSIRIENKDVDLLSSERNVTLAWKTRLSGAEKNSTVSIVKTLETIESDLRANRKAN